jgi:putative PIN family toxin of toxin-antitoxin system
MPSQKPSKVILDTNVWISFLIGKELQDLKELIVSERVKIITTDQLINEIRLATSRDKLIKYFNQDKETKYQTSFLYLTSLPTK